MRPANRVTKKLLGWVVYPFTGLFSLVQTVEKGFYFVRELLWSYPDTFFFGQSSFLGRFNSLYMLTRPYSHFSLAIVLTLMFALSAIYFGHTPLAAFNDNRLIEGVVMGVDDQGLTQRLPKVNPLVPSNIQLEKDLTELIYEPLIRFEQDGSVTPILAANILRRTEGAAYVFELREGVQWHDGRPFTTNDVIATLELMENLEIEGNTYVQAVKQMAWEKVGDNSVLICTITEQSRQLLEQDELDRPCSLAKGQKPILSNFLELLSIKIMPAHRVAELNTLNITTPEPLINRFPVGTGKYRFSSSNSNQISLQRNDNYYSAKPQIAQIQFKLFASEDAAIKALQNGEIHTLATVSTAYLREIGDYPQLITLKSPVLSNQYWAIYFNLRKSPDGTTVGPAFFQDAKVRRAITLAVNKSRVLDALLGVGTIAQGPISSVSDFFNSKAGWLEYSEIEANRLFDDAGWELNGQGVREKNGVELSFRLSYVSPRTIPAQEESTFLCDTLPTGLTTDREKTVASICQDLAAVGVRMVPDPHPAKELVDEVVSAKLFDTLLYGMHTFIDPDRYELFHSTQITGLNLAGYSSEEKSVQIKLQEDERDTVQVPKVDKLLEQGRSLDPLNAKDKRQEVYNEVQSILAKEVPAIFLYNPQFLYYSHRRLRGVDLTQANSIEERFRSIETWRILQ